MPARGFRLIPWLAVSYTTMTAKNGLSSLGAPASLLGALTFYCSAGPVGFHFAFQDVDAWAEVEVAASKAATVKPPENLAKRQEMIKEMLF